MSSFFSRKHSDPPAYFPSYLLPSLPFRRSSFNKSLSKSRHNSDTSTTSTATTSSATSASTAGTTDTTLSTFQSGHDSPNATSYNPFSSRSSTPLPAPIHALPLTPPPDKYLHGHTSHITCAKCSTDLALTSQIISKGFTGRHGRAYLVSGHPSSKFASTQRTSGRDGALPNTVLAKPIPRILVTGQHMVSDLTCCVCESLLGWKYVAASEESQKYKVGKFILETKKVRVVVGWDGEGGGTFGVGGGEEWVGKRDVERERERSLEDGSGSDKGTGKGVGGDGGDGVVVDVDELEFDSQDEDECEDLFAGVWSPALAKRRRQRKSERFRRKAAKVYVPRGSQESLAG